MNFLVIFYGTFIIGSYKSYGELTIHDEKFLTKTGAIASIVGCFRFIWSFAIDRYSYKLIYGILICTQIFLSFSFPFITR